MIKNELISNPTMVRAKIFIYNHCMSSSTYCSVFETGIKYKCVNFPSYSFIVFSISV